MTHKRTALFVTMLVLNTAVAASAAVTVRTPPVGELAAGGFAYCSIVNGGTAPAPVTMTLFSADAGLALATNPVTTGAKRASFGTRIATTGGGENDSSAPSWCECIVPDKTKVRCAFVYVNGNRDHVTVVPAQ